jgi:hypothetical protein
MTSPASLSDRRDVRIGGRAMGAARHVCAFFHSKDEEYRVLRSFIEEGLAAGEKAVHIVDPGRREEHRRHLAQVAGIDVDRAERDRLLDVLVWEQAYLQDQHFDQDRQLRLIEKVLKDGKAQGFPMTRLVANMEWALEDRPGVEDIVEYETRLNFVLPKYEDPVICTYDLARFNASVVMDMLRTHPVVIVGGILQENPLYVEPETFLKELKSRREG